MGNSTGPRELHVDRHLTNLSISYRPQGFIADQIAPIVTVAKQRDTYPVYKQSESMAVPDTKRAPGGAAKRVTRSVGSSFYQAENYALAADNTVEDMANMDEAYRALGGAGKSRFLLDLLGLDWEKRVLTLVSNTSGLQRAWEVNVLGTRHLLDAAASANVGRVVHLSSVRAFSDVDFPADVDEQHPVRPDLVGRHQPGDARGQHPRLPRTGTGEDKCVHRGQSDRGKLRRIQVVEQGGHELRADRSAYYIDRPRKEPTKVSTNIDSRLRDSPPK